MQCAKATKKLFSIEDSMIIQAELGGFTHIIELPNAFFLPSNGIPDDLLIMT